MRSIPLSEFLLRQRTPSAHSPWLHLYKKPWINPQTTISRLHCNKNKTKTKFKTLFTSSCPFHSINKPKKKKNTYRTFVEHVMCIPITMQLPLGDRRHRHMSHVRHARQSFSSKSHGLYGLQVLKRRQFRRRMPLAQNRQVLILQFEREFHNQIAIFNIPAEKLNARERERE